MFCGEIRKKILVSPNELQGDKTYHLTCSSNKDSNQLGYLHSLIRVCYLHEETLQPWLSKMCPVKILADLNLHWTHISEGTFSDVMALTLLFNSSYEIHYVI